MDPADRLAAFLAGELHADERAELEDALTRDPELRRLLAAMERADQAVAGLRSPTPPAGFDERLDRRLDEVLAGTLGQEAPTDDPTAPGVAADPVRADEELAARDELAARRGRRGPSPGLLGAVAAGVVLLAGGVVIGQLGDGLDGDDAATDTAADDLDADVDAEAPEEEAAAGATGPAVVDVDRAVDDDDLDALLEAEELTQLAAQRLDTTAGGDVARDYQQQLGVRVPGATDLATPDAEVQTDADDDADADDAADDADADVAEDEDDAAAPGDDAGDRPAADGETPLSPQQLPQIVTRDGEPLDEAVVQDLARCLDEVLTAQPDAIPVYAELVTFEGQDAVAFGLLTRQQDTGAFTRRELWALDLATCQTLRFSQAADDGR